MPTLGLITVLYNSDSVLEDFFAGISIQDYTDYKLYLIDNSANEASTILIDRLLKKYAIANVVYIDTKGNIGVAAGNNLGIKSALNDGCSFLLFLNNDLFISQVTLFSGMVTACEKYAMVTPKIYYFDSGLLWMAGGYIDSYIALGVHYGMKQKDSPKYNKAKFITYAPTCFLMVKSTVIEQIGMMDEKYFAYYDDTDFVYRAVKKGIKIWYEPSLHLSHKVSSSSGGDDSMFYIYYGNRNKLYFIKKHYHGVHKLYLYCYFLCTRFFYYVRFDSNRKKQLIKAIRDGFQM